MAKKGHAVKTVGGFKAIIPAEFDSEAVYDVLRTELEKFGKLYLIPKGETTTRFWKKSPVWIVETKVVPGEWRLSLKIKGESYLIKRWTYLDEGTKPHRIYPRRAKRLRFTWGGPKSYQAGSSPNQLFTSRPSVRGVTTYRRYVNHPGFPARGWSILIKNDSEKPLLSWMRAAMSNAARASGHAYGKG